MNATVKAGLVAASCLLLVACQGNGARADAGPLEDAGSLDAGSTDAGSADGGASDGGVTGLQLLSRIAGLWSGPATMTRLGDFPMVNMDFRAASPSVEFARVDLNAGNSLRFAFSIETFNGRDVLIFRNGGYFRGAVRDTRTLLVEHDDAAGTYRFCEVTRGCAYVDALFSFSAPDQLTLNVKVLGVTHEVWTATRKETRTLPMPFPADLTSQGPGTAPFPPMPSLSVTVSWTPPLAADADVWVLLSTTPCGTTGACTVSRSFTAAADAGTSQAVLVLDQLHAGDYKLNAVLDRNRNFATLLRADTGDGIAALDQPLTVAPTGQTSASAPIWVNVP